MDETRFGASTSDLKFAENFWKIESAPSERQNAIEVPGTKGQYISTYTTQPWDQILHPFRSMINRSLTNWENYN